MTARTQNIIADRVPHEAARLRAEGLSFREIAERLNIGVSTAHQYATDPTREHRYGRPCADCGKTAHGERCRQCANRRQHERACDAAVRAIQAAAADNAGIALGAQTWKARGLHPHVSAIQRLFGSWNAAIVAAGLALLTSGRPRTTCDAAIRAIQAAAANNDGIPLSAGGWAARGLRPNASTLRRLFGSWNAAIAAAGFTPRASRRGRTA